MKKIFFIILSVSLLASCTKEEIISQPKEAENLVLTTRLSDSISFADYKASSLKLAIQFSGVNIDASELNHDVKSYKINYYSVLNNKKILLSALVFIPESTLEQKIVSFQHGTTSAVASSPSNASATTQISLLFAGMSSAGAITVVPDYIGLGISNTGMNPYYVESLTTAQIRDGIYAAKELAESLGNSVSRDIYLAGYSQGGYVTMATHKSIEQSPMSEFDLKASFPAAGGYDVAGVRDFMLRQSTYSQPNYFAYVAQAYKTYHNFDEPLALLFKAPYDTIIPTLFDGLHSSSQINSALTSDVSALLTEDYISNSSDSKFDFFNDRITENSLLDWTPTIRMHLLHGDQDVTVPYQNSIDTYDYFIDQGASTSIVTFTNLPGSSHGTGLIPYIEYLAGELFPLVE